MKIIHHLADLLYRHQKNLEIIAIFLLCLTITFGFTNYKTEWLWSDKIYIPVILVLMLITVALVWIKIEQKKTNDLITNIKSEITAIKPNTENKLDELSQKQKQVFDLILVGKSNKEIMNDLCIELSTLKTHINKIYKTLGITSRKQVKKIKT